MKAPLLQQEWGCCKVETLQGACKDLELHRRDVCVCVCASTAGFLFFILWKKPLSCPPPRAGSPNQGLFQLQQNFSPSSALLNSHLSASPCYFCANPHHLLLSLAGPGEQRDPLPEGWHLERVLPPVQGDAGTVCSAHPAQQPPEAAVHRRLRHRWATPPTPVPRWEQAAGDQEEDGNDREGGRSLQSFKSPSMELFTHRERTCDGRLFRHHVTCSDCRLLAGLPVSWCSLLASWFSGAAACQAVTETHPVCKIQGGIVPAFALTFLYCPTPSAMCTNPRSRG